MKFCGTSGWVLCTAAVGFTPKAFAQAFNIDCGGRVETTPDSSYGAGAGQSGFWNPAGIVVDNLRDINGSLTSVRLGGSSVGVLNLDGATGNDELLMETVYQMSPSTLVSLTNLAPGHYDLYAYSWFPLDSDTHTVFFTARNGASEVIDSLTFGGPWPGGQIEGITFARIPVEVLPGRNFLTLNVVGGSAKSSNVLNGLQLVPIPAPGSAAFLFGVATLIAPRRR